MPAGRKWVVPLLLIAAAAAVLLHFTYLHFARAAYPVKYSDQVKDCAEMYGFDPAFLFALIHTESGFDPDAVSSAGARGLMQITPDTFKWAQQRTLGEVQMDEDHLSDPDLNILYGTIILSLLRDMYGNERAMLAAYNAGMGNVRKWLNDPQYSEDGITLSAIPYPETRRYVEKIPNTQRIYRELYHLPEIKEE